MWFKLTFLLVFGAVFSTVSPHSSDVAVSKFDNQDYGVHDSSGNDKIQKKFHTRQDPNHPLRRAKRVDTFSIPTLSKSSETVWEDAKVTVVCKINDFSGLEWTDPNGKTIKEKSWFNRHTYMEKTDELSNMSTLVIKGAELSDAGTYTCKTRSGAQAVFELTVVTSRGPVHPSKKVKHLSQITTPMLSKSSATVWEGSKVTVACSGNMSQELEWTDPNYETIEEQSWFFSRDVYIEKVEGINQTSILVIKYVKLSDSGTYSCYTKFSTQTSSPAVFQLTVIPYPKLTFQPDLNNVVLREGESYTVTCSANWRNVSWTNRNGNETFINSGGLNAVYAVSHPETNSAVLTIVNATRAHSRKYYCRGSDNGLKSEKILKVTVLKPRSSILLRNKRLALLSTPTLSKWSETAGEGSTVTVVCTGNNFYGLEWMKPNNKTIKEKSWLNKHIYTEIKTSSKTSTLVIKDLEPSDEGTYSCKTKSSTQTNSPAFFRLTVLPKPKPKLKPDEDNVELDEGDTYTVTCSGNWRNVSWRNSNGIEAFTYSGGLNPVYAVPNPLTNSSVLTIKNATTAHNGKYYCRVSVQGTEKEKSLKVTVQPIKLYFSVLPSTTFKAEGENYWLDETHTTEITCTGSVKNMNWKLNGADVTSFKSPRGYVVKSGINGRKAFSTIRFENPRKGIEGGQYLCSGLSAFDNKKIEKKFNLKIKEEPEPPIPTLVTDKPKIEDGKVILSVKQENYSIACVSSLDNITWFGPYNNVLLPSDKSPVNSRVYVEKPSDTTTGLKLVFNRPTLSDGGLYSCSGSRREKSRKISVAVSIFEPAYFNGTQASPVVVNATGNVTLECIVGGHPMPTVNWEFEDELIHDEPRMVYNGTSLTITNASWIDSGKYACIAQQPTITGVTIEKTVDLHVWDKPKCWFQNETVERVLRTKAMLTCTCVSIPLTFYTWFKDGAILRAASGNLAVNLTKDTVEIDFSRPEHLGLYRCRAENLLGFAEMNVTVVAMKSPLTPTITPTKATPSSITVHITMPGNKTITKYEISVKGANETTWTSYNYSDVTKRLFKIEELKKKTEYTLKARAMNEVGYGNFSSEIKYSTSIGVRLSVSIISWFSIFAVIVLNVSSNLHLTA